MSERRGTGALAAIATFKLLKAVLLAGLGVAALSLARDSASWATLEHWADALRFGPDERLIDRALAALSGLTARRLEELSVATFSYAAVFTTEGVGLLLRKRWAEYLTTFVTASFLPFELYELIHGPSALKVSGLLVNGLIVAYLARRLLKR